jgi:hypothetical protein
MKNVVLHIQYSHEPESEERRAGLACSETSCNFLVKWGISYMIWPNVQVLHLDASYCHHNTAISNQMSKFAVDQQY